MTKILNGAIGLLALLCCLTITRAAAQAPTASTAKLHVGQPFPYQVGVGIELTTYHRIREKLHVGDLVIASKNRLNDSLEAVLISERTLRQLDVAQLQHVEREYARQTLTMQQLAESYDRAVTAAAKAPPLQLRRPLLLQRGFWVGTGVGFLATLATGVVAMVRR